MTMASDSSEEMCVAKTEEAQVSEALRALLNGARVAWHSPMIRRCSHASCRLVFVCRALSLAGHLFSNNTCAVLHVGLLYNLWACNLLSLSTSIPMLAFNRFYANGPLEIKCSAHNFTLPEFQAIGYEIGSVQLPQADLATMLGWGQALFGISPEQD